MIDYRRSQTVIHFLVGESWDAPCGLRSLWHRGLAYTRTPGRTTCRRCLRWLAVSPYAPSSQLTRQLMPRTVRGVGADDPGERNGVEHHG